ncbi:MAG TPA: LptF/LptG family permease [Pirellulales bacterium]
MRIFTRYILFQLVLVTLTATLLLTALIFGGFVYQEAKDQGLGLTQVLQITPYLIPDTMRFALPAAALFAACFVYGRLGAQNEVIAVKSLGVHPFEVVSPALVFAAFLSIAAFWLNDLAVSWGRAGIESVVLEQFDQIVLSVLRRNRTFATSNLTLVVKSVEGNVLIAPMLTFTGGEEAPPVKVVAETASLAVDRQANSLTIAFQHGSIEVGAEATMQILDSFEHTISLSEIRRPGVDVRSPPWLPGAQIPDEIEKTKRKLQDVRFSLAAKSCQALLLGRIDELTNPTGEMARDRAVQPSRVALLARLYSEPWRRWAVSYSCFFFVLVGAPAALLLRNSDVLTTFAACFLPILLVYYPLLIMGIETSKSGDLPPFSVWIGNAVFAFIGWRLLRRVARY